MSIVQKPTVHRLFDNIDPTNPFQDRSELMRPRVHNKHHRTAPADAVYIGRGSYWGNPYTHLNGTKAKFVVDSRQEAIRLFKANVLPNLDLTALRGKHLVCFCKPQACHGDLLLEAANK